MFDVKKRKQNAEPRKEVATWLPAAMQYNFGKIDFQPGNEILIYYFKNGRKKVQPRR